jgi:hypothetical protein
MTPNSLLGEGRGWWQRETSGAYMGGPSYRHAPLSPTSAVEGTEVGEDYSHRILLLTGFLKIPTK